MAGVEVWTFADVVADPPEDMILKAVAEANDEGVDGVVSIGGAAPMDTAKLIAVLCNTEQPLDEMYGIGMVKGERLPLILAPTTAGTGSRGYSDFHCHHRRRREERRGFSSAAARLGRAGS